MPRPKRASDELYNIRRRMERAAKRLERSAERETDAVKRQGFLRQAEDLRKEKQGLYFKNLADTTQKREHAQDVIELAVKKSLDRSYRLLSTDTARKLSRVAFADQMMKTDAGALLYAYTSQIWAGTTNRAERQKRLFDFFGVDNNADLMDEFKRLTGIDVTETPVGAEERYREEHLQSILAINTRREEMLKANARNVITDVYGYDEDGLA